jgi:uncharacterized protein (TIGR02646 family)
MIKVEKDFNDIPASLLSQKVKDAFQNNTANQLYDSDDKLYKGKDVKEKLEKIYHKKCAFCEKSLLDTAKHVEHFRPKRNRPVSKCDATHAYYWLSFSWDNLLLACGECNISKGNCFDIRQARANYDNQILDDIHKLSDNYFHLEEPVLINPEKEDPKGRFFFERTGEIKPFNDTRMEYTIKICNLNRDELVERRLVILNDFINEVSEIIFTFTNIEDIKFLIFKIKKFAEKVIAKEEFTAWRNFIFENFEDFTKHPTNEQFNKIFKFALLKYQESINTST